jgi:hypothetical protein
MEDITNELFGSKCSAAQAQCLREIRESHAYEKLGVTWSTKLPAACNKLKLSAHPVTLPSPLLRWSSYVPTVSLETRPPSARLLQQPEAITKRGLLNILTSYHR